MVVLQRQNIKILMANFRIVVFQCSNFLRYTFNFHIQNGAKVTFSGLPSQRRSKHGLIINREHDNYWVPRKRPLTNDKLTFENKEFLQEVIDARFLRPGESPLRETTEERAQWTPESRRAGVITRKIGSYPQWTKEGKRFITTLLQVSDNHVIRYNPPEIFAQSTYANKYKEKEPFASLVVGAESADPQLFTAAYNGLFAEAGVMPKKKLTRFRITPDAAIEPGTPLFATHFKVGQYVNVYGITKYHGFQGVMKRWWFKGGPASHGCTKSHRRPGCIGGGWKDHVWKGKKMPGLHGGFRRLLVGLKVWRINTKYNILYVHGPAVPGETDNYCYVYDCHSPEKKKLKEDDPPFFPTYYPGDIEDVPEEYYADDLHAFSDPSVILEEAIEFKKLKIKK